MDFRRKDAVLPLKIMATICLGRYSGLVSYSLSQEKHPSSTDVQHNKAFLPTPAILGGVFSITAFFCVKNKHKYEHIHWLFIGAVLIAMSLSKSVGDYMMRNSSPSDWYKYKSIQSIIALSVFSIGTISLALEDH